MAVDRRAHVHDIDGLAGEQITDIPRYSRFSTYPRGEPLSAAEIGVDDGDYATPGALNRVCMPPPHQPSADDGGAYVRWGGWHDQTVASRSAPMCIPDKPRISSLSSWTRRPVVAEW